MQTRNLLLTFLALLAVLAGVTACTSTTAPGVAITITPKGFNTDQVPDSDSPFQLFNAAASSVTLCIVQSSHCESDPRWFDPNHQPWIGISHLPTLYTLPPHASIVFDIDDCSPPSTYIIAIAQQGNPTAQQLKITSMISYRCGGGEGG